MTQMATFAGGGGAGAALSAAAGGAVYSGGGPAAAPAFPHVPLLPPSYSAQRSAQRSSQQHSVKPTRSAARWRGAVIWKGDKKTI